MKRFAWAPIKRIDKNSYLIEQVNDDAPTWDGKEVRVTKTFESGKTTLQIESADDYTLREIREILLVCEDCD